MNVTVNPGNPALDRNGPPVDVCLVLMPYGVLSNPAIALGTLKACLEGSDLRSHVLYANLLFAEDIGLDAYRLISSFSLFLLGELTFSKAVFPDYGPNIDDHLGRAADTFFRHYRQQEPTPSALRRIRQEFERVRSRATVFIETLADLILARHPKIVACNSTFEQHLASLALLRRIKQRVPQVVTLMGGANCESEMGVATVREFPWVDVVFSGEADAVFLDLCQRLIKSGPGLRAADLPYGAIHREQALILSAGGQALSCIPRAVTENLDAVPVPDYSDYFEMVRSLPQVGPKIRPGLVMESSRGCWWGAKHSCTFCGLNGKSKPFRAKSPDRIIRELAQLAQSHGIRRFEMTDNIMGVDFFKTVLPQLASLSDPYYLFFELKANLTREQVRQLAAAGVGWLQPGIEALHDDLLQLMSKGMTAMANIQLMKYCRELGLHCSWNALTGFPGEHDDWHRETAAWLPLVFHLPPPTGVVPIKLQRFSVYQRNPKAYGLNLQPLPGYALVYPLAPAVLEELAYTFYDVPSQGLPAGQRTEQPGFVALEQRVKEWRSAYQATLPAMLCQADDGERIRIYDTRPCAPERILDLTGMPAAVYRACEPAIRRAALGDRIQVMTGTAPELPAIERGVEELKARKLLLELNGRLLSLAVAGDIPAPVPGFPGGDLPAGDFLRYVNELLSGVGLIKG